MSETAKTYINAAIMLVLAVALGCLFADSIKYMLGTDTDTVSATIFNDRMALVKEVFTEQNQQYQNLCQSLVNSDVDELRIMKNTDGELKLLTGGQVLGLDYLDGEDFEPAPVDEGEEPVLNSDLVLELFGDDIQAIATATDFANEPILDVGLSMIYLADDEVRFNMYSSEYGWIALIYTDKDKVIGSMDIVSVSYDNDHDDAWGILYSFED